jgi:hypothetical protein
MRSVTLPEFDVTVRTIRCGMRTIRLSAPDAAVARVLVESEFHAGDGHCPPEWCTDDVQSLVVQVRDVTPAR